MKLLCNDCIVKSAIQIILNWIEQGSSFGFLIRGLITSSLNGFGPKDNEELIILRNGSSATGNNSFNSLVGTGSNKHVVGLDAVLSLFSSSCPIVVKQLSFSFGCDEWSWNTRRCNIYIYYCISDVIYFFSKEINKVITIKLWGNI